MTTYISKIFRHHAKRPSSSHSQLWQRSISKLSVSQCSTSATESSTQLAAVADRTRRLDTWTRFYDREQRLAVTPRIEKITVDYVGKIGEPRCMRMTRGISAPIDCAKHLSQLLVDQSVVAIVNGQPWDMHRPLTDNCQVDFVHFKDAHHDPTVANEAFWRSSALVLAATLETAFRPEHQVRLLSLPSSNGCPSNGAFSCDVAFTLPVEASTPEAWWSPTGKELRAISLHGQRLAAGGFPFEVVDMPLDVVQNDLFGNEPVRQIQVRSQMGSVENSLGIPVYRLRDYVEVSSGCPLITSTKLIGRFAVACLRPLGWLLQQQQEGAESPPAVMVYRAYGVALPTAFLTHFTTFDRLIRWSASSADREMDGLPEYVTRL